MYSVYDAERWEWCHDELYSGNAEVRVSLWQLGGELEVCEHVRLL